MKTYGVGVLGCGEVWQRHRLAFENSDRLACVSVFDTEAQRTRDAAKLTGARAATSAADVLTADDVDIVAVLTPVFTHADLVEQGAAAGKHFMLEKPMAMALDDGERIVRAIRGAGVKCFHPILRALSSDLFARLAELTSETGALGRVRCGFYNLIASSLVPGGWMDRRECCFPPAEYDPHVFDTFLNLTGDEPASVWCHAANVCRNFEQDDVTTMAVTFHDGAFLQVNVHWILDPAWNSPPIVTFDLVCERGRIKHNWFSAEWFTADGQGSFFSDRLESQGKRWEHYHALIDAIETDGEVSPNEHDGLRYVRIQDAAIRSNATGQTVELDRDPDRSGTRKSSDLSGT